MRFSYSFQLSQTSVALKRLTKFLQNDEINPDHVEALPPNDPISVKVENGSFSWGKEEPVCLKKINVTIKEGQLVAVVGQVGSGKSSLCSAILGLMEKLNGEVAIKGSVAYVPQQVRAYNYDLFLPIK